MTNLDETDRLLDKLLDPKNELTFLRVFPKKLQDIYRKARKRKPNLKLIYKAQIARVLTQFLVRHIPSRRILSNFQIKFFSSTSCVTKNIKDIINNLINMCVCVGWGGGSLCSNRFEFRHS